jgi:SAM-dependent methyltransferase
MDLKEVGILGDAIGRHWYFRSKRAALLRLARACGAHHVLDVGAGSGFFARALLEHTGIGSATCVDIGYDADRDEEVLGKPLRFRRAAEPSDADLIVMMDVLEHVERDLALLHEYADPAAEGTRFIISVPALKWLWSGHDVFLDHYRRYSLDEAEDLARAAGLTVDRGMYHFGAVLPLAALARGPGLLDRLWGRGIVARSSLRRHHPVVNGVLSALCAAELPFLGWNRLAGLSVFLLATKGKPGAGAA